MTENLKIELLGKLASEKEILKQLKLRKPEFLLKRVKLDEKQDYLTEGWEEHKQYKSSIAIRKSKPHDIGFEDKVWSLFAMLGYNFLNKDRHLHLPYDKNNPKLTQQIDVFAKDSETILLVECKSAEENKRGDFKKELEAMKGKMEGLRKSIVSLFPNTKHKVKFILATRNFFVSEEDAERLRNIGGIHLNEESIDYFIALHGQIGLAAKYQLLGNMFQGQEIPEMESMVPAVEGKMGGHVYYAFSIEPEKLLKIGYVLHRNKANVNMMPTYQRLIKKARLNSVFEFIEDGGYFPNSIVVSIDAKKSYFERANKQVGSTLSNVGILHLPKKYRSAYIIDGQHRLYGYANSEYRKSNTVPVVAFINLSREEQVKLFMQINENQKTVSKDLRNTLNADLLWDSDNKNEQMRALCSRISIHLGESRDSALFNKISIGEDKKIITTQAIENALKKSTFLGKVTKSKIEELGTIYNGDLDYTYERLKDFLTMGFNYLKDNLPSEWERGTDSFLVINKGVYGIIMILSDILAHLRDVRQLDIKRESIKTIFNEAKTFLDPLVPFIKNIEEQAAEDLKSAYGSNGDTKYWRTFQKVIRSTHQEFDPAGLDEYFTREEKRFNDKAIAFIRDIELTFKTDFRTKLESFYGKKWFEKGVPPKIAEKALSDCFNKNRELEDDEKEVEPWDCLTIIAYREIALKNWQNIFEKDYTKPSEEKMSGGKEEKTKWMVKLERIRNQNFHSYSVTEEELNFLEQLYMWLVKKEIKNKFQVSLN